MYERDNAKSGVTADHPSPIEARGLGEQRLAAFLSRHGYTGRKPARELLGRPRNGAEGRAGELRARRQIVLGLVDALEPIVAAIRELTALIRQAVDDHADGQKFRSWFIAPDSVLCAATIIAEIGDCRDRYPSYRVLAADGGQAPVAVKLGKAKRAQFRWAGDHRLREAFSALPGRPSSPTQRRLGTAVTAGCPQGGARGLDGRPPGATSLPRG